MSLNILPDYEVLINSSPVDFIDIEYEHEPRDISNPPTFKLTVANRFGMHKSDYPTGGLLEIKRNTITVFKGTIEPRNFEMSPSSSTMMIEGTNKYYRILTNFICDSYDFVESAVDYGVTVNPWEFKMYRSTSPSIPLQDVSLIGPPVYGYRHDEVVKHIIGEKFLFGHKFDDLSYLLPVSTKTEFTTNKAQVLRNPSFPEQTTPRLQLTPNGSGVWNTSGIVESVPLFNGDPNIEPMGQLNNCRVRIYGTIPASCSVVIDVCRNGGQTYSKNNLTFLTSQRPARNWINVGTFNTGNKQTQTLLYKDRLGVDHTAISSVITVDYWEGTISFSGSEAHKNSLAYRLTLTGPGTTTPHIEYIHFDCNTVSDTAVTSGTIDTYVDADSVSGSEFFEGNLESSRRLEALKNVRLSTINTTDPLNHFWDVWINTSGQINFKKNRGSTLTTPTYSFESKKFKDIKYEFDGSDIWWKCVAYGAGSGAVRTRIVSDEEFSAGGLKKASVQTAYGDAARVGIFEDTNAVNISQLLRSARAAFKLHQQPYETLTLPSGLIPSTQLLFDVGDSIHVIITDLDIDKQFPVENISITVSGDGEDVKVVLGEPLRSLAGAISSLNSSNEQVYVVRQPSNSQSGLAAPGITFDNINRGLFTFGIAQPENVKKVALKVITVPFTSTSKSVSVSIPTTTGLTDTRSVTTSWSEGFNTRATNLYNVSFPSSFSASSIRKIEVYISGDAPTNPCEVSVVSFLRDTAPNNYQVDLLSIQHDPGVNLNGSNKILHSFTITSEMIIQKFGNITIDSMRFGASILDYSSNTITNFNAVAKVHYNPTSALQFGNYRFDGDGGTGTSSAIKYAKAVNLWVDPDSITAPTTGQLPVTFGDEATSIELDEFDVTSWLTRDANGIIVRGIHKVLVGTTNNASPNVNGLGSVQIVPLVDYIQE